MKTLFCQCFVICVVGVLTLGCEEKLPKGTCGDGHRDPGEYCDDGYTDACGSCNADCTAAGTGATCGDSVVCPEMELCDDGYADACGTCNGTCTGAGLTNTCGDGVVCPENNEACDDGNTKDGDYCSADCSTVTGLCGDGEVQGNESCDDGYTDACGTCNATCSGNGSGLGECGDGIVCPENNEVCDDGYTDACGTCNATCTGAGTGSTCGDNELCPEKEVCDDGYTNACGPCNANCTGAGVSNVCGDGIVCPEIGEACDDGYKDTCGTCNTDCSGAGTGLGTCGDGVLCPENDEVCDDNNNNDDDYCSANCATVTGKCGDNVKQDNEFCDDGYADACGTCNTDCSGAGTGLGVCGDGDLCEENNEVCDDGNTADGDYCAADCGEVYGECGDKIVQDIEVCDDGDTTDGDLCSSDCQTLNFNCTLDQLSGVGSTGSRFIDHSQDLVAFCDGWVLIASRIKNQIYLYNTFTQQTMATYQLSSTPGDFEYDPDNMVVYITVSPATMLVKLDLVTGTITEISLDASVLEGLTKSTTALDLALGNDGKVFASLDNNPEEIYWDRPIILVDGETNTIEKTWILEDTREVLLAYDQPGEQLIAAESGSNNFSRYAFDSTAMTLTHTETNPDAGSGGVDLAISPDGNHIAFVCSVGNGSGYTIFDYRSDALDTIYGEWDTDYRPASAAFSRDGLHLVSTNRKDLQVFDVATHRKLAENVIDLDNCWYEDEYKVAFSNSGNTAYVIMECDYQNNDGKIFWMRFVP